MRAVRFFLDFLRADQKAKVISVPDARYGGLTPAQSFCDAKPNDGNYKKDSDCGAGLSRVRRLSSEARP